MSTAYLVLSLIGLAAASAAWFKSRPKGPVIMLQFLTGWIVGELALQMLVLYAAGALLFGALGAFDAWPGIVGLGLSFGSAGLLIACQLRSLGARAEVEALANAHGLDVELDDVGPAHGLLHPFRMRRPGVRAMRNVEYGAALPGDKGGRNLLDVVMPDGPIEAGARRPVLLQIHGGAWIIGDKEQQGQPLMAHLATRGWVSFAINYRLSPQATFPDHIVDVKRAIGWIREHAREYGADPDFICVTGGSAGGHLTGLTALSANDPRFQPGFEDVDTRVAAAVPFYGVFDWLDRAGDRGEYAMEPLLAERVLKCTPDANRELWDAGSPISHISPEAPPLLAIQGSHDSLVFAEEAHTFIGALKEKSQQAVMHLEMEGGQHAFDSFHSVRSAYAVRAATGFLEKIRAESEARLAGAS
jgi:acetyl esterase/lipase